MKNRILYVLVAVFLFMVAIWGAINSPGSPVNAEEESDNWTASANVSIHFDSALTVEFGNSLKQALLSYSANWVKSFSDNLTLIIDNAIDDVYNRQDILVNQTINTIVVFLFFILVTGLAAWKQNAFLDIIAALVNSICGFKFTGDQEPGSIGWLVGIMIILIGGWFLFNRITMEIKRFIKNQAEKNKESEEG